MFFFKLNDTGHMFYNCRSITFLNISNWNIANVSNSEGMFKNCISLSIIYNNINNKVKNDKNIFKGNINYTFAHIETHNDDDDHSSSVDISDDD